MKKNSMKILVFSLLSAASYTALAQDTTTLTNGLTRFSTTLDNKIAFKNLAQNLQKAKSDVEKAEALIQLRKDIGLEKSTDKIVELFLQEHSAGTFNKNESVTIMKELIAHLYNIHQTRHGEWYLEDNKSILIQ